MHHDAGSSVRRVFQRVGVLWPFAALDAADFFTDGNHGINEAVYFVERFAFGGLNHECVGHGERQCGGVEAVVHQAFGYVFGHYTAGFFQMTQVQNALVRYAAVGAGVQGGVVVFQACADVVGAQNGGFGGVFQAISAHHADIHPCDGQHEGVAVLACRNCAYAAGDATSLVAWQVGSEVFNYAHWTHAWAAAAVRHGEGFVQVQVAYVAAKLARCGNAYECVHVGTVYVDAATVLVYQLAQLGNGGFKHAVGAGVGNHHARQVGRVLFALGLQVCHIDVALLVALGNDYSHASHLCAGGVGAVGAGWNQADVAVALAFCFVPGANGQQASVFARCARVGLYAYSSVASDLRQPASELPVDPAEAFELNGRGNWVGLGPLGNK